MDSSSDKGGKNISILHGVVVIICRAAKSYTPLHY
jgi:hypothetical protein